MACTYCLPRQIISSSCSRRRSVRTAGAATMTVSSMSAVRNETSRMAYPSCFAVRCARRLDPDLFFRIIGLRCGSGDRFLGQLRRAVPAAGDFLEIQIRVPNFRDAKLPEQRVALADDVDVVAIAEKRALRGAVGNRPVAKKLHVARQGRGRRRRRNRWPLETTCFLSGLLHFLRRRRRNWAKQIAPAAFVLGLLARVLLVALQRRIFDPQRLVRHLAILRRRRCDRVAATLVPPHERCHHDQRRQHNAFVSLVHQVVRKYVLMCIETRTRPFAPCTESAFASSPSTA